MKFSLEDGENDEKVELTFNINAIDDFYCFSCKRIPLKSDMVYCPTCLKKKPRTFCKNV